MLGWLAALPVAAVGAVLTVAILRAIDAFFGRIQPISVQVAGRELLRVDLIERMGLSGAADWVGATTDLGALAVLAVFVALAVAGAAVTALGVALVAWGYNALVAAGLGLEVELESRDGPGRWLETDSQLPNSRPEWPTAP